MNKKAKKMKPNLIILDVMFGKQEKTKGFDCAVKMKQDKDLAPVPGPGTLAKAEHSFYNDSYSHINLQRMTSWHEKW